MKLYMFRKTILLMCGMFSYVLVRSFFLNTPELHFNMILHFWWRNYCIPCVFIAYCENGHRWRVVPGHCCNTTAPLTRITKCPLWRIVASRPEHTLLQVALFHISNYVVSKHWTDKCDFTFSFKYVIFNCR